MLHQRSIFQDFSLIPVSVVLECSSSLSSNKCIFSSELHEHFFSTINAESIVVNVLEVPDGDCMNNLCINIHLKKLFNDILLLFKVRPFRIYECHHCSSFSLILLLESSVL